MQKTALHDEHVKLDGRIVDFNGWALPVQFSGIVDEHHHTRSRASLFDCSHMGEYRVLGQAAIDRFNAEVISDVSKIPLGRCRYGALLNDSGGIVDDLITFRLGEEELYIVTNAGPLDSVTSRLCEGEAGAEHVSYETSKVDVQGPAARDMVLEAGFEEAGTLTYFSARWSQWRGREVLISRTGYTGELGYELFMENDLAPDLWKVFLSMDGVKPAGLGARDTLRTEVGYALSGQDLGTWATPLDSAMETFVAWDTEFVGKSALESQRDRGDYSRLVGVVSKDRRAPRHDFEVKAGEVVVGKVTSGTFGPSVGHGIGLARIHGGYAKPGTILSAGPKKIVLEVAEIPFYKDGTCRIKI